MDNGRSQQQQQQQQQHQYRPMTASPNNRSYGGIAYPASNTPPTTDEEPYAAPLSPSSLSRPDLILTRSNNSNSTFSPSAPNSRVTTPHSSASLARNPSLYQSTSTNYNPQQQLFSPSQEAAIQKSMGNDMVRMVDTAANDSDEQQQNAEDEKRKKTKRLKVLIMSVVGLVLFFATVAIFGVLNSKEGNARLQTAFSSRPPGKTISVFNTTQTPIKDPSSLDPSSNEFICNNFDLVQVFANVSAIDTVAGVMKLHFLFFPCGKFMTIDPVQGRSNLGVNLNITIDSTVFRFTKDLPMSSQDISIRFARGDINNYPIETFESNSFQISGVYLPTDLALPKNPPVPLRLSIVGALQTFSIDIPEVVDISDDGDGLALSVRKFYDKSVLGVCDGDHVGFERSDFLSGRFALGEAV
ncbi:hypothetical protein HDU97_010009 [Phlyctochytrium planicorne]|nr:hypothetical protein HDU97_010009 [Phlyctochytrium planicorne]